MDLDKHIQDLFSSYKRSIERPIFIPFRIPDMDRYMPGIAPGSYMCITGDTNTGKTPFTKWMYAVNPVRTTQLDYHCIYFALEEDALTFSSTLITNWIYNTLNETYSIRDLMGFSRKNPMEHLPTGWEAGASGYLRDMYDKVALVDNCFSVESIKQRVIDQLNLVGELTIKGSPVRSISQIQDGTSLVYHTDKDLVTIVIDHINELETDMLSNKYSAMGELSAFFRHYILKANPHKLHVCNVQQQSNETNDKLGKGANWMPSQYALGNNKELKRVYTDMLGIGFPKKAGLANWEQFDLTSDEGDVLRVVKILKQRFGAFGQEIPVFMVGQCTHVGKAVSEIKRRAIAY